METFKYLEKKSLCSHTEFSEWEAGLPTIAPNGLNFGKIGRNTALNQT